MRHDALAGQQRGLEPGLTAPAWGLFDAGGALHLHGAFIELPAQRAHVGVNGQGYLHEGSPSPGLRHEDSLAAEVSDTRTSAVQ